MRRMFCCLLLLLLPGLVIAEQPITDALVTDWQKLVVPGNTPQDTIYAGLSEEEKGLAGWVVFMEENRPKKVELEEAAMLADLKRAEAQLAKKGFEWKAWRAARNAAAKNIASQMLGKKVVLEGFLLPVTGKERLTVLVPWISSSPIGPPPPPNQAVVVQVPEEIGLPPVYVPVVVEGVLREERKTYLVGLQRGKINISTDYGLTVESMVPFNQAEGMESVVE